MIKYQLTTVLQNAETFRHHAVKTKKLISLIDINIDILIYQYASYFIHCEKYKNLNKAWHTGLLTKSMASKDYTIILKTIDSYIQQ